MLLKIETLTKSGSNLLIETSLDRQFIYPSLDMTPRSEGKDAKPPRKFSICFSESLG